MEIKTNQDSVFNFTFKVKCIILLVIGFVFYINTVANEAALDDGIVIIHNDYVQKGFKGVGKILSTDAYDSYYKSMNANQMLAGGRYRPLSIVVFAIEHEIIGSDSWHIMHFVSILFYLLCILVIFYFLHNYFFKKTPGGEDMAFLATVLFAIHPMHTEVVANVKSLDEILSLLCIGLTLIFGLRYLEKKEPLMMIFSLTFYFLALLAKEYGVMMLFVFPLVFYLLANKKPLESLVCTMPYIAIIALYLYVRFQSIGIPYVASKEELNNAHAFTQHMQRLSSYIVIVNLVSALAVPVVYYFYFKKNLATALYNSIPYYIVFLLFLLRPIQFPNIAHSVPTDEILNNPYMLATPMQKTASEIFVLGKYLYMMFIPYPLSSDYSYAALPYRDFSDTLVVLSILTYAFLFVWLVWLVIKKNILAIPLAFYLVNIFMVSNLLLDLGATMGERLAFHSSLGFVIILSYGVLILLKKISLQQKRIMVMGFTSILVVLCAAEDLPRNMQWKSDVTLFTHDVHVVPNSVMVNGNAGARFIELSERKENSAHSKELIDTAIHYLRKSIDMHKTYTNSYLNIGIAFYKLEMPDSAKFYWDIAKKLYPDHPNLKTYYPLLAQEYLNKAMTFGKTGDIEGAIRIMKKALIADNNNADVWYNLGGAYFTIKQYDSARYAWNTTIALKPEYPQAKQGLSALPPPTKGVEIKGIR